jgi:hypothetical protein
VKQWKIFVVVKNCQRRPKVKIFSTSSPLIWNPVVCHGAGVLGFALMMPPNDRLNKRLCYTRQGKNPDVITTHCFLHREILVSKTIGKYLKHVLDVAVNMVNFIKQRPLKSRMFTKLCKNMQKDYVILLQHTEVSWLSRGKVLTTVFVLREELLLFFKDNDKASFSDFLEGTK